MIITHHASGSKANAYTIRTTDRIVIDAGVKGLECEVFLLTHTHGDHYRYFGEYIAKCKVFVTSMAVLDDVLRKNWALKQLIMEKIRVDAFADTYVTEHYYIKPFDLKHDVPCCGFIIQEYQGHKYVHVSDTGWFKVTDDMKNADFLTIESNYDESMLRAGNRYRKLKERIERTHLSNTEAAELAYQITRQNGLVAFVHTSSECNYPMIAKNAHRAKLDGIRAIYPEGEVVYNKEMP